MKVKILKEKNEKEKEGDELRKSNIEENSQERENGECIKNLVSVATETEIEPVRLKPRIH